MDIRLKIINWLLHEDEYISKKTPAIIELETSDKPKQQPLTPITTPTKQEGGMKRKVAPIVYGTDVSQGVIKLRPDGYWAYCYQEGCDYQKKGDLNDLKIKLDKFHKMNKPAKQVWNEIFEIQSKNSKYSNKSPYITKTRNKYLIYKSIKGKTYYFGRYTTYEKAEVIRNYLEFKKWDLTYLPQNITGHKKLKVDEYYLHMLPFIAGDAEYEMYMKK